MTMLADEQALMERRMRRRRALNNKMRAAKNARYMKPKEAQGMFTDEMTAKLATPLPPDDIKVLPRTGQQYIPITRVVEMLDEDFGPGRWEFVVDDSGVVPAGDRVYAHCRGVLLVADGEGALSVRLPGMGASTASGGKGIDESYPAALSFAMKNAAKKLGARYGRYLGRVRVDAPQQPYNAPPRPPRAPGGYSGNYPRADGPPPQNGVQPGRCQAEMEGNPECWGKVGQRHDGSYFEFCGPCADRRSGSRSQATADDYDRN